VTKKQRICRERKAKEWQTFCEVENLFPVRYHSLDEAVKNRNPLKFGDAGWESAPFEQRFVALK